MPINDLPTFLDYFTGVMQQLAPPR